MWLLILARRGMGGSRTGVPRKCDLCIHRLDYTDGVLEGWSGGGGGYPVLRVGRRYTYTTAGGKQAFLDKF